MQLSHYVCITQDFIISEYKNTKTNKLILSSNHPEGYYEILPVEKNTVKEHHLFLVVKEELTCFQDRVFRTISFYEKKHNTKIHAFPGRLTYHGKQRSCIRFRESEIQDILNLIQDFEKREIYFEKKKRTKIKPYKSFVQFKKYIEAEIIDYNIFRDTQAKHIFYVPIPEDIEFEYFKKLVQHIRNNCDFKSFDASLVYSLDKNYRVQDFAKIYSPNCETKRLKEFAEKFESAMREVDKI
jgi:hypothetical protein